MKKKMMVMFVLALVGILMSVATAFANPLSYEAEVYYDVVSTQEAPRISSYQVAPNASWSNPLRPGGTFTAMGTVSNLEPGMFVEFVLSVLPWDSRLPAQRTLIHRTPVLVNGHFDIGGLRTLTRNNVSGHYSVEAWLFDSQGNFIDFRAGMFWFRVEPNWP